MQRSMRMQFLSKGEAMAKRYHQTRMDRRNESEGTRRFDERSSKVSHKPNHFNDSKHHDAEPYMMGEYYSGADDRRRQEMEDAGMIHEDRRQIANLPQEVMMKPYRMTGPYNPEVLDDTIEGIDRQMDYDDSKRAEHFYPKKV